MKRDVRRCANVGNGTCERRTHDRERVDVSQGAGIE